MAAVRLPDVNSRPLTISPELGKNPCFNSSSVMLNTDSVPPIVKQGGDLHRMCLSESTTLGRLHPLERPWELNPKAPDFFPRRRPFSTTNTNLHPLERHWEPNPEAPDFFPRRRPSSATIRTKPKRTRARPCGKNNLPTIWELNPKALIFKPK